MLFLSVIICPLAKFTPHFDRSTSHIWILKFLCIITSDNSPVKWYHYFSHRLTLERTWNFATTVNLVAEVFTINAVLPCLQSRKLRSEPWQFWSINVNILFAIMTLLEYLTCYDTSLIKFASGSEPPEIMFGSKMFERFTASLRPGLSDC